MTYTVHNGHLTMNFSAVIDTQVEYVNPKQTLKAIGCRDIGVLLAAENFSSLLFFENHLGIFIDIYGRAS
jgi:hypothetical protein